MSASDNMFILAYRKMNTSMEGSVNVFTNDSTNPDMIFNVQCVLNIPLNKEIFFFLQSPMEFLPLRQPFRIQISSTFLHLLPIKCICGVMETTFLKDICVLQKQKQKDLRPQRDFTQTSTYV